MSQVDVAAKAASPTRYQNFFLVTITTVLVGVSIGMVQYKVPTILTTIMADYHMDAATGSWLMSIFTLMTVFTAIPASRLAQRHGAQRIIVVAAIITIVASAIGAFAPSGAVLMFTRALEGMAMTAISTCGPIVLENNIAPNRTGTALGFWGTWGSIGSTAGALLTPTIFVLFGFTVLWLAYSVLVIVFTAIMLICVRDKSRDAALMLRQAPPSEKPRYREMFTLSTICSLIGFLACNMCILAILGFIPTIMQAHGMDATMSGFVSTLPMLLSIISSPLFGAISDRTGKIKPLLVLSLVVLGPCVLVMYTTTGAPMWIAAVLMGLIGLGSIGLMLAGFLLALPKRNQRTIGTGVFTTCQGVGQFLGTWLVQALLGPSFENVMLAGVVVMIISFVGAFALLFVKYRDDSAVQ